MKLVLPVLLRDELHERVQEIAPQAQIVWVDAEGQADGEIADAEIFLRWFFPPSVFNHLIAKMPHLRWLHIPRAGVDGSITPQLMKPTITITNSVGVHAAPIAEFVLLFMLSHVKAARELYQMQQNQDWNDEKLQLDELTDKTILIIGLGQIGQAVATRAAAFGMRVVGSSRSGKPLPGFSQVVSDGGWRELLGEVHFVVLATPLTPETRTMFGAAELAAMRPDAYLINVARGEILDEPALIAALKAKQIAGAGLDVTVQEPLPAENPLWKLPNVTLTPHISWSAPEVRPRIIELFLDNLQRYMASEPLRNIVDKQAGY